MQKLAIFFNDTSAAVILARTGSDVPVLHLYHVAKIVSNKEAVTISRDFVLISYLLINPQVLSLNLQRNKNVVTIRCDLILISCLFIIHQVLSI